MAVQMIANRYRTAWYIYAFKGGPLIRRHDGPRRPTLNAEDHRKIAEAMAARNAEPDHIFRHVIRECLRSPEWEGLAVGTRRVWQTHVDRIEAKWGEFPIGVWNDPRMTRKVIEWRNTFKKTPRTADIAVTVLSWMLKWAKLNGFVAINAAADIPRLYKGGQRQEIVWTAMDMEAFADAAIELERPWLIDGLRLAALTGFRREDLVTVTLDQVGEFAVEKTALKKSKGKRRRATIPMTDELRVLLAELRGRDRKEGVRTLLVNSFGAPWSADGFGGSFNRVRDAAKIAHVDDEGRKRVKHLHDLRGTFCTLLIGECELTDEQAGSIMGWAPGRVAEIRRVYVDDSQVVVAIGKRITAKQRAKQP